MKVSTVEQAGGARSLWLGGAYVAIFGLAGLLAYIGPLGFAPLVAIGGVFALVLGRQARWPGLATWPWLALALWGVVSMRWSPLTQAMDLSRLLADFEKLTALKLVSQAVLYGAFITAAATLPEAMARRALTGLAVGIVGLSALVLVEGFNGAALYQMIKQAIGDPIRPDLAVKNVAQATYILALFCWPAAMVLSARFASRMGQWMAALLFVGLIAGSWSMSSDSALAAFALGALVYFMVVAFGGWAIGMLAAATLVYWMAAPFLVLFAVDHGLFSRAHHSLGASWDARLDIWEFATTQIMTHPMFGWGLDASRTFGNAIPLHTHDGALQVWLELGAVGACIIALAWMLIMKLVYDLARTDRRLAAVAAASASAYLMIGAVSFGIWQEWWLALGALAVAVVVALGRVRTQAFLASDDLISLQLDSLS